MRLFNEKNSKFSPEILADVDDDVIVDTINKDFAEYNMQADYMYDGCYLKEGLVTRGNRVELPLYIFRYTIKYPNANLAAEAAEEYEKGRNLNYVIPAYDPNGLGGIFSERKSPRSVEFELTIPGTIVWELMKKRKGWESQKAAKPQKVFLKYLEEILEIFVNDDRLYYYNTK